MTHFKKYIRGNNTALFDWLVLGVSFLLGFAFPSLLDFVSSPYFSYWMLAALVLYAAGVWLKQLPLYYRINRSGNSPETVPLTLFLVIGHWIIFLVVFIFAETAIRKILGIPPENVKDAAKGTFMFSSMIVATFITYLVFRSPAKMKKRVGLSAQYLFRRELIADIFLLTAVSILSFVFWEKGIIKLLTYKPTASVGDVWFLFIFLAIAYILFYLPLRYLFLVEDHFSRKTWRRMLLIFAFLLIKSLLEMLKI